MIVLAILLLWHIGSVVVWLGSSVAFTLEFLPTLRSLDKQLKKSLFRSIFPRFSRLLGISSISTILAGLTLLGYISSDDTASMPNGWGFVFIVTGAVLGLVAIIITLGVIIPLGSRFTNKTSLETRDPKTKEGTLDEETMFRGISSSMSAVVVILAIVLVLMVLGANI